MEQTLRISPQSPKQPIELLTAAVKQIGRESMPKTHDLSAKIHFVRVQCKRLRALLELIRLDISETEYINAKRRIKAAACKLTAIRDSHVLRETLESAAGEFGRQKRLKQGRRIESTLSPRNVPLERQAYRHSYRLLRQAMAGLPHPHHTANNLREFSCPGLRTSYGRARAGMLKSRRNPKAEFFHQWRKSAKCLFSQLELLHYAGLPIKVAILKSLDALQCDLGKHRDLLLAETFAAGQHVPKALRKAIRQRRKRLQSDVLRRGKRLFSKLNPVW